MYVLRGTGLHWKQVVGYEFTGGGFNGALLKTIISQIISNAEKIGLRVNSVTCNMGLCNQAYWNAFGVTASRKAGVLNSIPHPRSNPERRLYFFADVSYLLKNMVVSIINNGKLFIPEDIQETYNLPKNVVDSNHLVEMLNLQQDLVFLFTSSLKVSEKIEIFKR